MNRKSLTILLAIDRTESCSPALTQAIALAKSRRAHVHAVHVWGPDPGWASVIDARSMLKDVVEEFRRQGIEADERLQMASGRGLGRDIAAAADETGADLVVLGSSGSSDLKTLLRGSASHQVLNEVNQAVLVLRGEGPALVPRRILAATAGGDEARLAATAAIVAVSSRAQVTVLHVPDAAFGIGVAWTEPAEHARSTAEGTAAEFWRAGLAATAEVRWGPVAYTITETARIEGCDLIVLGSRPPSDLAALLLDSVSHQVVQRSDRPVLFAKRDVKARNAASPGSALDRSLRTDSHLHVL